MTIGLLIAVIQIGFAFACVRAAKRKGRLNNWWVVAAAMFGVFAYATILALPARGEAMR
jgi:hypothetical protein